ncbi:MAG: hypothetical protein GWP59_06910 [Chlamydiales bacterium]|nr:hypothetical protein [Chlamydiales bacterium]
MPKAASPKAIEVPSACPRRTIWLIIEIATPDAKQIAAILALFLKSGLKKSLAKSAAPETVSCDSN